jgi:hypothetical protein
MAASRSRLPKSAFAIPSKRLYPINTKSRARAALAYAARPTTRGSYSTVRKAVLKKYPSLKATAGSSRPTRGAVSRSSRRGTSRKTVKRSTR